MLLLVTSIASWAEDNPDKLIPYAILLSFVYLFF